MTELDLLLDISTKLDSLLIILAQVQVVIVQTFIGGSALLIILVMYKFIKIFIK